MPHITIEYSSNIADRLHVDTCIRRVHDAAMTTGIFADDALRTRASERRHFRVADGHPDNAFVHVTLRMRPGRTPEVKQAAGRVIYQAICDHLAPIFADSPLGLTFEMQEIDVANRFHTSTIGDHMKKRGWTAPTKQE